MGRLIPQLCPVLLGAPLLWLGCAPPPEVDAGPQAIGCALQNDCGEGDGRPSRRSELDAVYDPVGQRMIIYGGSTAIPEECSFPPPEFVDETWAFHDRCGIWKRIEGTSPGPRTRHMMAYDPAGRRVLLTGGRFRQGTSGNYVNYNDLWQLDLETDRWSELQVSNAPTARVHAAFEVNGDGTKAYLFGGNISLSGLNYNVQSDLWELDLETYTWTELTPQGLAPQPRQWFGSLFDATRERLVIMGGSDNNALFATDYFADVWAYDVPSNTWMQLHTGLGIAPAGRYGAEWVHDTENDRYLLFAGHDDTELANTNDTWAFDPSDNTWEQLRPGDTWNKPSNGFCDFPPDFTVVDQDAPERRNSFVAAYSSYAECPSLIVSMGKTDCGATDDTQRWLVGEERWDMVIEAREGEMCLRTDTKFDCFEMCQ